MLKVNKTEEPEFFKEYNKPQRFDDYDSEKKQELKLHMLDKEQTVNNGYVCTYCERNISELESCHIEHIRPKASDKFPQLQHDYNNFTVSCNSANSRHCGHKKGSEYNDDFINPVEDDPNIYLTYNIMNGEVIPIKNSGRDYEKAIETIRILNLNYCSLVNARKKVLSYLYSSKEQAEIIIQNSVEFPSLMNFYKNKILGKNST